MEPTEAQGSWGVPESSQGPRLPPQGGTNTACLCSSIQSPCLFLTPHPQAKSGKQLSANGVYGAPTVSMGMGPRKRNKLHTWPVLDMQRLALWAAILLGALVSCTFS